MPPFRSSSDTLCLHSVRLLGGADVPRIAARFRQDLEATQESLLDFESVGWTSCAAFGGRRAWSLTDAGRAENTRQLSAELDESGARESVVRAHAAFAPLNGRFLTATTDWQLRPLPGAPMAANDHTDHRWDDRVLERLESLGRQVVRIADQLSGALARFEGYDSRYDAALRHVVAGDVRWVDAIEVDSCHLVWMQLHEDLLATLGLERGDHP